MQFACFATDNLSKLTMAGDYCDRFSARRRLVDLTAGDVTLLGAQCRLLLRVPIVVPHCVGWTQNERCSWQICGLNQ